MCPMRYSAVFCLAFCVTGAAAQDASQPRFTARELFYSAAPDQAPQAKPAPKPVTPPKPTVAAKKPPVKTTPTQSAAVTTPSQPSTPATAPSTASESVTRPDGGMVVKTALVTAPAPQSGTPLGLRYTILQKSGDEMQEVAPDTVFHSGDKIQVSIQTNGPGYLYVILRGTSGTWKPLFPSPEIEDGNNHVDGWNAKVLPPKRRWAFDEQTGIEHLFIVFSRTPEEGLEKMIYSLQDGATAKPAAEKAVEKPPQKKYLMTASVDIPDSAVGRMRETYTRDLIIEKVDDQTPEDKSNKKENAVYVVNPSGSADSRVVAEVKLVHQ